MNKNGFTLTELLVTIVIIAIVMIMVFPSAMRVSNDNKNRLYEEYARMMEEYALVSPLKNRDNVDTLGIGLHELGDLDKSISDCSGYVLRESVSPLKFKAYIKCGDYTNSSSYNASLAR